jgi:hypothetical protein
MIGSTCLRISFSGSEVPLLSTSSMSRYCFGRLAGSMPILSLESSSVTTARTCSASRYPRSAAFSDVTALIPAGACGGLGLSFSGGCAAFFS